MRISSESSLILKPSDDASRAPRERFRAVVEPDVSIEEKFRVSSLFRGLRLRMSVQAIIVTARQQWKLRAGARRFEKNIKRLEELAPHLLDDIGVIKLENGDFEVISELLHEAPALSRKDIDLPSLSENFSPPTCPRGSTNARGKAA